MRIGIMGGTFNPPHKGHINAARSAQREIGLDRLIFIPAGIPPHKEMDNSASAEDRMEMCRLAFRDVEGVIVSDIEIKRDGKSYSIDTLRHMSCEDQRLFMLCGTDMMLTLGDWDDADEIFKLCYPVYIRREEDRALDAKIIEKNTEYFEKYGKYVIKLDSPVIDISSTELRAKMKNGEDVSAYVDAEVLKYIQEKGLYQ